MSEIQIIENVLKANDEVAGINRQHFREAGVFTLDLIGSPGCGKTTLLEQTLRRLDGELTCGVVVGDLATTRDAERLKRWSPHVVQINTGRGCHLEAHQVRQAIDHLDLAALDLLVIENVGNLICPVGFDLGQDHKIAMFSITEGDDKAAKHPHVVVAAELILLNKMDLLGPISFDLELFRSDVARLHADVPIMQVSAKETGDGLDGWLDWLRQGAKQYAASQSA
jgi:hydrogenase nickel incorporation protein HypB